MALAGSTSPAVQLPWQLTAHPMPRAKVIPFVSSCDQHTLYTRCSAEYTHTHTHTHTAYLPDVYLLCNTSCTVHSIRSGGQSPYHTRTCYLQVHLLLVATEDTEILSTCRETASTFFKCHT